MPKIVKKDWKMSTMGRVGDGQLFKLSGLKKAKTYRLDKWVKTNTACITAVESGRSYLKPKSTPVILL